MSNLSELLFNAVAEDCTLTQLTELAVHEIFHNPIMITNHAFRVLNLVSQTEVDDPVWKQAQQYGSFTEDNIQIFKDSTNAKVVMEEKKPLLYDVDLGREIPRIICPVLHNKRVIGLITLIGWSHPITDTDMNDITIFAKAVSVLLRDHRVNTSPGMGLTNFLLRNFLEGKKDLAILPEEKLFYENRNHCVYVSELPDDEISKGYLSYLQDTMEKIDPDVHAFSYENTFFVLYSGSNTKKYRTVTDSILKLLKQFSLYTAVSMPFTDLMELKMNYDLARTTITVGRRLNPEQAVYACRDYMDYVMISRMPVEQLKAMITPEYKKLVQYDDKYAGELILTAGMYYEKGFNITEAAKALHVHRNTVAYRLDMIKEKLKINAEDMNVLRGIYRSWQIQKWMNKNTDHI